MFPGWVQIFGSDSMIHFFYQVLVSGWYWTTYSLIHSPTHTIINQSINQGPPHSINQAHSLIHPLNHSLTLSIVFYKGIWVPENKHSLTNLQQHMAENRAKPVRTMAASFTGKTFLFSEAHLTVLGRFISAINSQYAENMWYSHPRWGRPNWFSGKHFSVENGVLTMDSEKFQSIVINFRLRCQVFDSWRQSAQH